MKRVVPIAVGLAAGMAVGFSLGAMVTRHDEPIVVIHNATDEKLQSVFFQTDFHPTFIRRIPATEGYSISELQPHHTSTIRLSSHRPTGLTVRAFTAGGKKLSSEEVHVASRDVVFALISSNGIKVQSERLRSF